MSMRFLAFAVLTVALLASCGSPDKCPNVSCLSPEQECMPATGLCAHVDGGVDAVDAGEGGDAGEDAGTGGGQDGGDGGGVCEPACPAGKPVCDQGTCRVCTPFSGCAGALGVCDGAAEDGLGACVECAGSSDCSKASAPFCGAAGTCVPAPGDGGATNACASAAAILLGPLPDGGLGASLTVDTASGSAAYLGSGCGTPMADGREQVLRLHLNAAQDVHVSAEPTDSADPVLFLRSAPCATGSELPSACIDETGGGETEQLNVLNVQPGDYYLFVDSYSEQTSGKQRVTVWLSPPTGPPSNDSCAAPIDIAFDGGSSATLVADTATAIDDYQGGCLYTTGGRDLVYRLSLASAKDVTISVAGEAGVDPAIYLRKSPCTAGGEPARACRNASGPGGTETMTLLGLPAGDYFLVLDSPFTGTAGKQTVVVSLAPPTSIPAGDTCANAIPLIVDGGSTITISGSTEGFENDYGNVCGSPQAYSGGDVVYELRTTAPRKVSITVTPALGDGGVLWPHVYIREPADCERPGRAPDGGGPGCQVAPTEGSPLELVASSLPAGTYFVIVDAEGGTTNGPFSMTVKLSAPDLAPSNQSCGSAKALTFTNGSAVVLGNTRGAASNTSNGECFVSESQAGADVVYKVSTGASSGGYNARYQVESLNAFELAPLLNVRTTCAGTLGSDQLVCDGNPFAHWDGFGLLLGVPPSTTQYVWVDSSDAVLRQGPFRLQVDVAAVPAPNDVCSGAVVLPSNTTLSGTTLGASDDLDPVSGCSSFSGPDVVYKYTAPSTGTATLMVAPQRGYDVAAYVLAGACNPSSCSAEADSAGLGGAETVTFAVTAGTKYFIVVDYWDVGETAGGRGGFTLGVAQ